MNMKVISYIIKDELGIHARPAGLLVKEASKFDCHIVIKKGTKETDAKSILGVMAMGVKNGEEIAVTFEGADEDEASETIRAFLNNNL
jgi:phosphocarrier protein